MVFTREDGYNISETGNWNVASDYSKLKIMKPLYLCDIYENIARFGYDNFIEQLENMGVPTDVLKISGFERLVNELIRLCGNVKFAMSVGKTRNELEELEEKLVRIRSLIPVLFKTVTRQKRKEVKLVEEKYFKALDAVLEIKSKLNEPLNKNHLIFTAKEEFDPQEFKRSVFEGATTRG